MLDKNNHTLGLLMSGSSSQSLYNPIHYVLKELNVRLVTTENLY
ncbi:hypothetical protein [Clostridium botulinum]|nr:hypothetical protein [Clostridium botulinum]AEB76391.1 putative hypothetical protein [Clostridium botulinum BKT015925]